ncbi:MAG: zinc metallopeptidase [Clostridiales bacterium]|jgi:Zn-dependent membrane protease YugP|nr:zinc metallopeptidase [Clostridiales bacterium]
MFYYDPTVILVILGIIVSLWAQIRVQGTFNRYSRESSRMGMPASLVARRVLDAYDLRDVQVKGVPGKLSDHYDPRHKVVCLSEPVYNSSSLAAIGVAVHEVGHAIQDSEEYFPLRIRSALAPVASIGSNLAWPLVIAGLIFSFFSLIQIGIICFTAVVFFQLITLPVEFNASRRALAILSGDGYLDREEIKASKKVLNAAALTYLAAALVGILQLLRLLLLSRRN